MLYASTGETYDTCDIAQDRNRLSGTIPRITFESQPAPATRLRFKNTVRRLSAELLHRDPTA